MSHSPTNSDARSTPASGEYVSVQCASDANLSKSIGGLDIDSRSTIARTDFASGTAHAYTDPAPVYFVASM